VDGPPFALSETPAGVRGPGPLLGEHTRQVLGGVLGLTEQQLSDLTDAGIVSGP
jgi:formyl-CoA transferase